MTFLIIIILFFILLTYSKHKTLANPAFIFNAVWLIGFIFVKLGLSYTYRYNFSSHSIFVFFIMIVSFNIAFLIFSYNKLKVNQAAKKRDLKKSVLVLIKSKSKIKYIKKIFFIWLILILFETIYYGGIPLIWKLLGLGGSYATFGIPSLHGFINSLSWFILSISFLHFLKNKDNESLKIIVFINVVYILLLARQSIITEVIQFTAIYMLTRKIKIKKLLLIGLFTIIGFGIIGNIRTDPTHLIISSHLIWNEIPQYLIGFIWVYMYIMTPIVNVGYFFDNFKMFTYGGSSLITFLPTAVSNVLKLKVVDTTSYLISPVYNVSSALLIPYQDFGTVGVSLFSLFIGAWGGMLFKKVKSNREDERNICNFSVYLGIISLTFFSNMLLSLPIITQFIYINILFKNYFYIEEGETKL